MQHINGIYHYCFTPLWHQPNDPAIHTSVHHNQINSHPLVAHHVMGCQAKLQPTVLASMFPPFGPPEVPSWRVLIPEPDSKGFFDLFSQTLFPRDLTFQMAHYRANPTTVVP